MIIKNKGLTEESQKAICIDLMLFLRYLGDKKLSKVKVSDVENFLYYVQTERKNCDASIERKYTTLNSFFKILIMKELLPDDFRNPLDKIEKIKVRKKIKDYMTETEVQKVFDYLENKNDLRGLAITYLLYASACRINEIYQLDRDSLDMDMRRFKIMGKGNKERICYFSEKAKEKILNYLNSRADNLKPLFISREHNRWSKKQIQVFIRNIIKAVGINKHITPHSFRHSILTNMRLKGALLEDLQLLAGHANIGTTQAVYTHVGLNDVSSKFDNFFSNNLN